MIQTNYMQPDTKNLRFIGLSVFAVLLAIAWLLPNHYPPWGTFHTDAWLAAVLLLLMGLRLLRSDTAAISSTVVLITALSLVPWAQFGLGILPLASDAFVNFLYLFGFAAAFFFGENWARLQPGQPAKFVLTAAAVASLVSVVLQIYQWLGYANDAGFEAIWVFEFADTGRPYANLAQPNQLASLLLWGALGMWWIRAKGYIGPRIGACAAAFILFGVALTESRAAALTATVGVILISARKSAVFDAKQVREVQLLYTIYLLFLVSVEPLAHFLGMTVSATFFDRMASEATRFELWRMGLYASLESPWLGFGWNHSNDAFLTVFPAFPRFANLYVKQSHNLPLDLVLWVGWPAAAILLFLMIKWLLKAVTSATDFEQVVTLSAIGVISVHAMVELPLHHGYFLWPFGLLAGSLSAKFGASPTTAISGRAAAVPAFALIAVLGLVARDYFRVEAAFSELRFQLMHIGQKHDERPPETVFLTAWRDFIVMARTEPRTGMSARELKHWHDLLLYNTSPLPFKKLVIALVKNGRKEEAEYWAVRSCAVLAAPVCRQLIDEWTPAVEGSSRPQLPTSQVKPPSEARKQGSSGDTLIDQTRPIESR